eukprot:m51a1_g12508 hypothetical protein (175) ;mRNA; r:407-1105
MSRSLLFLVALLAVAAVAMPPYKLCSGGYDACDGLTCARVPEAKCFNEMTGNTCSAVWRTAPDSEPARCFWTWEDNQNTTTVLRNSVMEVKLEGNPTTGFSWLPQRKFGNGVKYLSYSYESKCPHTEDEEPMVGCGGLFTFRFRARANGVIHMHYAQPWERVAVKEYVLQVRVN